MTGFGPLKGQVDGMLESIINICFPVVPAVVDSSKYLKLLKRKYNEF